MPQPSDNVKFSVVSVYRCLMLRTPSLSLSLTFDILYRVFKRWILLWFRSQLREETGGACGVGSTSVIVAVRHLRYKGESYLLFSSALTHTHSLQNTRRGCL